MSSLVFIILISISVSIALGYALYNFYSVKKLDEGSQRMQEIALAIRQGANTFIRNEYRSLSLIMLIVASILTVFISWQMAISFILGAVMSGTAAWVGLKIATYCNVRVSNVARTSKSLAETLKVAYRGGSVMGLSVGAFALLGILLVYLCFGLFDGQIAAVMEGRERLNFLGFPIPFTVTLSGYALGCSLIAMFNRVGGGIYTKAADMGADLVGKTEAKIAEDDPRNPATIADNVGDNVGDVAGLGADLLESYVGAILASAILACELYRSHASPISAELLRRMIIYPVVFAALGLLACVLGTMSLLVKPKLSTKAHRELNLSTWISASLSLIFGLGLTAWLFKSRPDLDLKSAQFRLGFISPWLAACFGVMAGIAIGLLAEYYTSYSYKPTLSVAESTLEGTALTITSGMSVGMRSTMAPVIVLASAIYGSYSVAGIYGVAIAAMGMLSFVTATVSVDTYGPIADNAGGISEMSSLDAEVRIITDTLDAVGNTTAAIGKGFAIGSAALAALSMMVSYLYAATPAAEVISLNLVQPISLVGAMIGAALPFLFSGFLIDAVSKTARTMVNEVRRQFKEISGVLEGQTQPDYKRCIEISSDGALREMRKPALISVLFPVCTGFIFGPKFVGGVLIGATLSAIMLALYTGNAGGAWDNAKKYIEIGGLAGSERGSEAHNAAIIGDTVGDPLKDTVGPSLDILIKIMSVSSLIAVSIFSHYNLLDYLLSKW
ncbi:MAG: sodium-translocating pyrophosphatase [Eubacteriales bacterium]|nr:sodium-translocating pyrophosphatase [Eubacteriales bacterium]